MKTIGKSKIYMLVAIMAVLVLSVGLSFCVWDTDSLQSQIDGGSALFGNDNYILGYDANSNNVADVGDTVWFGNYFQQANEITKTPLEWRVVDIRPENGKNILYLLSEKAVAYGSFWGATECFDEHGNFIYPKKYSQCYNESTVRAWLNSLVRTDGGVDFNGENTTRRVFNGFYNEAFSATQKNSIIGRTISGMAGSYYGDPDSKVAKSYDTLLNEKVWLPSITEVFGVNFMDRSQSEGNLGNAYFGDNINDVQFQYYKGVGNMVPGYYEILCSYPTEYALSDFGNYTNLAMHPGRENQVVSWPTRSPFDATKASGSGNSTVGQIGARISSNYCNSCGFAVRPAICLEQ